MNEETKKSLMKLGLIGLPDMEFEVWQKLRKQIAVDAEEKRRKNDPAFVQRYDIHEYESEMREDPVGDYVLYEDFVRFVKTLEEKVSKAYEDGRSVGSDGSCSWRD